MVNIRRIVYPLITPNYCQINREERNYAAIFFAALCNPDNAQKFLAKSGYSEKIGPDFGIYFEYAYLRDLWNQITSEDVKKDIIRQHLKIQRIDEILNQPTIEINKQFGVTGNPSNKFVQYPG